MEVIFHTVSTSKPKEELNTAEYKASYQKSSREYHVYDSRI